MPKNKRRRMIRGLSPHNMLAFQHGNAMEDMVRQNAHMVEASTWPYVTPGFSNSDAKGGHLYKIMVSNNGVGPAKIGRIEFSYKGRKVEDRVALARLIAADADHKGRLSFSMSDTGGVLPARQVVDLLTVIPPMSPSWLVDAFRRSSSSIDVTVCYCSIFKDCWSSDTNHEPVQVVACSPGLHRFSA